MRRRKASRHTLFAVLIIHLPWGGGVRAEGGKTHLQEQKVNKKKKKQEVYQKKMRQSQEENDI